VKNLFSKTRVYAAIGTFCLLALISYGEYNYYSLKNHTDEIELSLEKTLKELSAIQTENVDLTSRLLQEKQTNDSFTEQIGKISSSVGTLEKLYKTDPQLLQKYSKIYFLNENYTPSNLTEIDFKYLSDTKKGLQIHSGVLPHLKQMFVDAEDAGVQLRVLSAYRSFDTQTAVKLGYKYLYGSGANQFSADQGYSEHQLGTTLDLDTASGTATTLKTAFEKTKAFEWLNKNAYKYGFTLSYPKKNTYYQFEPWHWRFVGVDLAKKLHENGQYFYEMDQRTINTYLANFFD